MNNILCNENNDLVEIVNERLTNRLSQLVITETLISPRSEQTRYTLPLQGSIPIPQCSPIKIKINKQTALTDQNFIERGSWANYIQNINTESVLKRQHIALQKFPQADFIPNSTSDLYNCPLERENNYLFQGAHANALFPNLQNSDLVSWHHSEPKCNSGKNLWNNQSRTIY